VPPYDGLEFIGAIAD